MFLVDDIRKTRVYQEAKEEGIQEGVAKERQRSFQEKLNAISKMAALNIAAADIARILGMDLDLVRQTIAKGQS